MNLIAILCIKDSCTGASSKLCFEPQTRVQSLLDENDFFFICK